MLLYFTKTLLFLTGIYIIIKLLDLIGVFIDYQITKLELKKIGENVKYDIYINSLKIVHKPFELIYSSLRRLKLKTKISIDIDLVFSFILTIITFLESTRALYSVVYLLIRIIFIRITLVEDAYAYFTLTIVLTIVAYFPDKVGLWMQNSLNRFLRVISKKKIKGLNEEELYTSKSIIILLRPKLWVYFVSIFITVISSFEKISNTTIFINNLWIQIKPIISESVISFIVIDRFVNLFKNEYKKINQEVMKLTHKSVKPLE